MTIKRLVLLSARRAYEFRPDSIRLTVLSMGKVQELIRRAFDFQIARIAAPPELIGPVPATDPPGLVFKVGNIDWPEGQETPVRFLHIEAQRIVIDVAGHSEAINAVWDKLRQILVAARSPDGMPALGDPIRQLEHSEITARLDFPPDAILAQPLRDVLAKSRQPARGDADWWTVPALSFRVQPAARLFSGTGGVSSFRLEPRAGEPPEQHIYYSVTPLPSEAHLAYLEDLQAALAMPSDQETSSSTTARRTRRKTSP